MPLINIEFDDTKVSEKEAADLSAAVQAVVSKATDIEDVFVYANSAKIKVKVAPIEIFVQMSRDKVSNSQKLFSDIREGLSSWKTENNFQHPINLTLIPMDWQFETGI